MYIYYFLFVIVFSIALLIANIVCFKKKTYPCLFFIMLLFLPEFYGFEFSEALPILTVTRIMFVIFYVYAFINRRQNLSLSFSKIKSMSKVNYLLIGYFLFRIVSNLYYVFTYAQAIKTILEIIFEQLLLIFAIRMLSPTKKEIDNLITAIVWACCAMFIIGIIESLYGFKFGNMLYTVNRPMLNAYHLRLGLLRSTVTMGLPNFYGNMCVIMLPLILYAYAIHKKKSYLFIVVLDILANIHSGCRSDLIFFVVLAVLFYIVLAFEKPTWKKVFQDSLVVLLSVGIVLGILSLCSPNCRYFYEGTGKSILNEFGYNFDLDEGAPDGVEGYGGNDGVSTGYGGTASRTRQFTGIIYTLQTNPLFGLGSGAQVRKDVRYLRNGKWVPSVTYDVGYVEIACDEGLLGIIAFVLLSLYIVIIGKGIKVHLLKRNLALSFITYAICMLSSANMFHFLFFLLIILMSSNDFIMKGKMQ
ncbi:O-antigen ligase family protein [Butyrivibrio sp. AE2032]|uniref:O-antigen ligase family protein n=1 Tax=Butyrivibrio sp. AE2032 TaxID=1458463 RepID=UPI0005560574|nr:hypothetical protein [Butyrivibrio sp. AE2032]